MKIFSMICYTFSGIKVVSRCFEHFDHPKWHLRWPKYMNVLIAKLVITIRVQNT